MTYICSIRIYICPLIFKGRIYTSYFVFICRLIFDEHIHVTHHDQICRLTTTTSPHTVLGFHPTHVYRRRTFQTLNQPTWYHVHVLFKPPYYSDTLTCVTYSKSDILDAQVHRVTRFPNRLMTGLCGVTRCLIGASFLKKLYLSNLLYSCVFFFSSHSTVICLLSWVTLQLSLESFGVSVYSSLPWGLATWREAVEEDCQLAIYKPHALCIALRDQGSLLAWTSKSGWRTHDLSMS